MAMNNSLAEVHPELVSEWSEKNLPLTPDDITFGSNKKVWWRGACGHEWQTSVKARSNGEKCPICSGARVIAGINDLATLEPLLVKQWSKKNKIKPTEVSIGSHNKVLAGFNDLATLLPDIAAEWSDRNYPILPTQVTVFANRKAWWKCKDCGREWNTLISTRSGGSKCPYCSGYIFLKEKEHYPQWLESQEERRAKIEETKRNREILYNAPPEKEVEKEPEEAELLQDVKYEYHLGDKVYIGASEYEILSVDEERVMLYDYDVPLFNKEFSRTEFDRKVRENPMNEHLIVKEEPAEERNEKEPEPVVPAWEQKKKVKGFDLHPDVSMAERHTFNLKENEVETVGKKERFRRNIMAIQLLKKCQEEDNSIPADPTVRTFSYTVVDNKIYYRENSRMTPVEV